MLTIKHYFLKDKERFEMEEVILSNSSAISRDEVYNLDDQELTQMYESFKGKEYATSAS
ncbi:hypothetical protein [Mesobacillus foraminis]|uniref:hypothetical protein n=1 Tax=Mesobacillus foraminis TaxID=279826 RepID=UPI0013CE9514|nr:hypothetical protein [Mesobacillus foraminis]